MLATKFIIALCPATPIYLAAPSRAPKGAITRVKDDACRFDTFDAAMEVAKGITGWGGAQRVEQVAVEVEDTRSTIATDDDLYEIRDAATAAYTEAEGDTYSRACAVEGALRDLGLLCRTNGDPASSASVSVYVADHLGNTAQFDWDPMQDGFDITEATCLAEAEPETATCDGCENAFPIDEVEVCGEAEHGAFGFCATCLAEGEAERERMYLADNDIEPLTNEQVQNTIDRVNSILRADYRDENGNWSNAVFGLAGDTGGWIALMESYGEVEVASYFTLDGRPHVIKL